MRFVVIIMIRISYTLKKEQEGWKWITGCGKIPKGVTNQNSLRSTALEGTALR